MHKLSIGAIFCNEAPSLKEWLDHYINRNVDHFYLINDNSNDNFKEVLDPYIQKGYITLFNVTEDLDMNMEDKTRFIIIFSFL